MLRRLAWWLSLAVLVATGILGLYNGVSEWRLAHGALQQSVTLGVIVYGVFGAVAAVALVRGSRHARILSMIWGVTVVYVSGVASIAYGGGEPSIVGAVMAALGSAAIASGVVWTARHVTGATRSRDVTSD
jgi:hypothetical protein